MQQSQKAAAEPEAERCGIIGLERERRVVQFQLLNGVAQVLKLASVQREYPAEHDGLNLLITGKRLLCGLFRIRERIAYGDVLNGFNTCGNVADVPRGKRIDRLQTGREHARLRHLVYFF